MDALALAIGPKIRATRALHYRRSSRSLGTGASPPPGSGSTTASRRHSPGTPASARLCEEAGLVKVGLIAIDGTKLHANASHHANLHYEQLAREIFKEAARIDAAEDELYGEQRGDELPEQLRTSEGRRAALADARRKLARSGERLHGCRDG